MDRPYVAENNRVVRFPYMNGMLAATGEPEVVVPNLPQGAGRLPGRGHWTRDVAFSPDGVGMFVSVGSYSNAQTEGEDETNRAAILAFDPNGTFWGMTATGMRNPVSLAFSPLNGALWATNTESLTKSSQRGATSANTGASLTILFEIPVSDATKRGIGISGLTSE